MVAVDKASVLRELHDLHAAVIWRYVVHLTRNPSTADDIVQETLLRAWRTPRILDEDPASVRSWLFTVARNLVIDDARSARHRHEVAVEEPPDRTVEDRTDGLFDVLLVEEALKALSEDHRAVIVRAYFGGQNTVELAAELNVAEGTVKSRLHYGLRALRLVLQERGVTR
ncbi:MAG TPA: sigma-70 family RNA polymerase sigma factor [Demequina sp.]|nr:sigma-70 family RNA polymerase sigma factor [Demequina sp.]